MSLHRGVDFTKLPDQFEGFIPGRMLILDGDGPAYRVAATCKRLDTAIRRYQQDMLTQLFLTGSESVRIHLTASNSDKCGRFRIKAAKPYQGNRSNKDKPSLLEPLREAMTDRRNWLAEFDEVIMNRKKEADDAMITDAYIYKEHGVIWSDDKDLNMTPYPQWDRTAGVLLPSDPFGSLAMKYSAAGVGKCTGRSLLFFWAQMLMGDTADNVKGILTLKGKTCGAVGAYEYLKDTKSATEAANLVLDAYRDIDQNPLPEGWLLFLHRNETDSFWKYLSELQLTKENRHYIDRCVIRDWFQATT
jgi:hypothetical protein